MNDARNDAKNDAMAQLRFAVVGPLLAAPPPRGGLQDALRALAAQDYELPDGSRRRFSASAIERWYYAALGNDDVMSALRRRRRSDAGRRRALPEPLLAALREQHAQWPWWTVQLHYDNLRTRVEADPALGPMPSYSTVLRAMADLGLARRARGAEDRGPERERPSYEVSRSNALWHADFHVSRLAVPDRSGAWTKPRLLAFIDDHSRYVLHAQWYPSETSEAFAHGLRQAIAKAGLPRSLMTDNGSATIAGEVQRGLQDLGVLFSPTQPRTPEQNGRIEHFWSGVEGRLMAMVDHDAPPGLAQLDTLTHAWLHQEYHRRMQREIGTTPLCRLMESPDAARPVPDAAVLDLAFAVVRTHAVRRTDGTVVVDKVRFQLPPAWRHLKRVVLRYARWDLSRADLVDPGEPMLGLARLWPLDKARNADRPRRALPTTERPAAGPRETPPLLERYMDRHEESGLPAAWLPFGTRSARPEGDTGDE